MLKKIPLLAATLTLIFSLNAYAAESISLLPVNATVLGAPGSAVGWGFTIASDINYLMVFDVTGDFLAGWGDFTGFSSDMGSFVVAPGTPVTHPFDATFQTGAGSFNIHPGALPGSVASGTIDVTYGLFIVSPDDPNFNPDTDIVSLDNIASNPASITVTGGAAVPEPSTVLLLGAGMGGLLLWRKRRAG